MSKIKKKNKAYTQFLNSRDEKDYEKYAKARNQYKYTSSKTKVRQDISDLEKSDGTLTTSDKEKAETPYSFFSSVFTVEESEIPAIQKSTVQELHILRCGKAADSPKAR